MFALVFGWKVALFLLSAQPVPSNDAFFYDGAVVHQLQHGGYFNPSIALSNPISGTQVFSAYPPLYQAALWLWMRVFGTSALAAMALHLALFGGYVLVLFQILKRLNMPVWCLHLAGIFLLLLTFQDRPDSLAHLFGMLAICSWVYSRRIFNSEHPEPRRARWHWLMALFSVLTLCTSLQIGCTYLFCLWAGMAATTLAGREPFPVGPMAMTLVAPAILVAVVKFCFPLWWSGFMENALQTPSFTGLRLPSFSSDILKVARTTPGVCLVAAFLPWAWFSQHNDIEHPEYARHEFVLIPALLGALGVVAACLFALTPNTVAIANYLQPLIVASYAAFCVTIFPGQRWVRWQVICLALAAVIGSTRAVGMSTWGLACASDVSYAQAVNRVDEELAKLPAGSKVVVSSAFLYEASKHGDLTLIHSDWLHPAKLSPPVTDWAALAALKPPKLILTEFDYYRQYEAILKHLTNEPASSGIQVTNTAKISPPDAYPRLQRVVQHISWAPVIVDLSWRE